MKDPRQERLGRLQRKYHRTHPWRLGPGGLFVPHSHAEIKPDALSWWDAWASFWACSFSAFARSAASRSLARRLLAMLIATAHTSAPRSARNHRVFMPKPCEHAF